MNILVIGSGGREHALAWKLSQSAMSSKVYVAPGNAGTLSEPGIENVDIHAEDIPALIEFAQQNEIALTVVGPEAPLVAGVVDQFRSNALRIFGPTEYAAQLEGSKGFAKEFMAEQGIPTASYEEFTDVQAAQHYIDTNSGPFVVKADGLAAGKGVVVTESATEAKQAVDAMLSGQAHGDAGKKIIIEEFLQGQEASFICIVDGEDVIPLATSQDHKARDNGDQGPNTGGMGAYSPAPIVTQALHEKIMQKVILPTAHGFIQRGHPYQGFLYAGLMITSDQDIKVLEFNCRFGDPETQPIMMRLQSDLAQLCLAATDHTLAQESAEWDPRSAVGVVLAAGGYPEGYRKGDVIKGLESADSESTKVFHAGTKIQDGNVITNGGRVLCVTALGDNLQTAQRSAYAAVENISWENMYYRTDIGYRGIESS